MEEQNNTWKQIHNRDIVQFVSPFEDEIIYIIKTGHTQPTGDVYIVIWDDAYMETTGKTKLLNATQIQIKFGIDLYAVEKQELEHSQDNVIIPKYLYRPDDYALFEQNSDGTFKLMGSNSHSYSYDVLLSHKFIPCTQADFPDIAKKRDQHMEYLSWSTRPDGHGGAKGGTMEEYLTYKRRNQ